MCKLPLQELTLLRNLYLPTSSPYNYTQLTTTLQVQLLIYYEPHFYLSELYIYRENPKTNIYLIFSDASSKVSYGIPLCALSAIGHTR